MATRPAGSAFTGVPSRISATRALKNVRHLQKVAPHIVPEVEPPGGFGSIIPYDILAQLHRPEKRAAMRADARFPKMLKDVEFPSVGNLSGDPLFHGEMYFARIEFTIQNQNNAVIAVSAADVGTAVQYATEASPSISAYAAQYGSNNVSVHQAVIPYAVTLPAATYNDAQLRSWVNAIASNNGLSGSACVVVLNPEGMVNTSGSRSQGIGGYHGNANLPYIFVNLFGQNLTVPDEGFAYSQILSHEIAEMVVDPLVDGKNPEVCDGCGPNCQSVFLGYFDAGGSYLGTSQSFPPGFPYRFYINSIVQPASATLCPAPVSACKYGPPLILRRPQRVLDHERDAAWLIQLWLLIHGPDPAPIILGGINKEIALLATVRAIVGLTHCLGDAPVEKAVLEALRPLADRVAVQLRQEL
jgi:hypothetical protein